MSGMVIFQNIWVEEAPSSSAASYRPGSTPMMAAIKMMVVLPNHIRKFISPTSPRAVHTLDSQRTGSLTMPSLSRMELMGAVSALENSVKNSMANAEAMIRLGM